MSGYLFPYASLIGVKFDYVRQYLPATVVQEAESGVTSTIALRAYPLVHFAYSFEFLRDPTDINSIVGLINAVGGRFDTFLHSDPDFNSVTAMQFGTGDGSTAAFQLTATYGSPGVPELIQNLNGTPQIFVGGTLQPGANYTLGPTGIVTFGAGHIPASSAAITWTGSFYYRCRFDEDKYEFKKMMKGLWYVDDITFTSMTL